MRLQLGLITQDLCGQDRSRAMDGAGVPRVHWPRHHQPHMSAAGAEDTGHLLTGHTPEPVLINLEEILMELRPTYLGGDSIETILASVWLEK